MAKNKQPKQQLLTQEQLQAKYKYFDVYKALQPLVQALQDKVVRCTTCDEKGTANAIHSSIQDTLRILNDLPPYSIKLLSLLKEIAYVTSNDVYYGYVTVARADLAVNTLKARFAKEGKHNVDCA